MTTLFAILSTDIYQPCPTSHQLLSIRPGINTSTIASIGNVPLSFAKISQPLSSSLGREFSLSLSDFLLIMICRVSVSRGGGGGQLAFDIF